MNQKQIKTKLKQLALLSQPVEDALAKTPKVHLDDEGLPLEKYEDICYVYAMNTVYTTLEVGFKTLGFNDLATKELINPLVVEALADDLYLNLTETTPPELLNVFLSINQDLKIQNLQAVLVSGGEKLATAVIDEVVRCVVELEGKVSDKEVTDSKSSNVVDFKGKNLH